MTDAMERAVKAAREKAASWIDYDDMTTAGIVFVMSRLDQLLDAALRELGRCPTCEGDGLKHGFTETRPGVGRLPCPTCDGTGNLPKLDGTPHPCPDCIDGKDWKGLLEALGLEDVILNHSESEGWVSFDGVARLPE